MRIPGPAPYLRNAFSPLSRSLMFSGWTSGFSGLANRTSCEVNLMPRRIPSCAAAMSRLRLLRIVAIALGEAQPRLDDRENVPEIMRQARGHLAKRRDPLAGPGASPAGRVIARCPGRFRYCSWPLELGGSGRIAFERQS